MGANTISDKFDLANRPGGANPDGPAKSLVLRVARGSLTDLFPHGIALPDLLALPSDRAYLYIGGFDITGDWTLTGTLETNPNLKNSATGFQAKVTDLHVPTTPIPVPAALPLLLVGVGAIGGIRLARRR